MNYKYNSSKANVLELTDFCKGIAVIWISLVHYQGGWFGWQGVHTFIVLSGFGLAYSCLKKGKNLHWKAWYMKRFRRIMPVYWLAVLGSLPFLAVFQIVQNQEIWTSFAQTFLNFFLLRNFFDDFIGGGAGAFWYIPFIVSFYLIFPVFYKAIKNICFRQNYWLLLLAVAAFEFLYRATAIYKLDGFPIAYDHAQFFGLFSQSVSPLDNLPDVWFGFLQKRVPFCFFPSRIIEFTLGIVAAFALVENSQKLNKQLLNSYMGWLGLLVWLAGQLLLVIGLWGWIFADFVIGLGLILWLLNLAFFLHRRAPNLFQKVSWLGTWSYYIFLTHQPFTRVFRGIEIKLLENDSSFEIFFSFILFGLFLTSVGIASWLAKKFDQSKFPQLIVQKLCKA